ncbi:MAG: hypothetical protein LBU36_01505 [Clostridiales bacterium]|jgi:hypothetical protein|nr:hypothetical protein [Clostridiales bacterium]
MKKRRNIAVLVIAALFLAVSTFLFTMFNLTPENPDYTVFSTDAKGASLLYDTLQATGRGLGIAYEHIRPEVIDDGVQIIIEPDVKYTTDGDIEDIIKYAENGGSVMYFTDRPELPLNLMIMQGFGKSRIERRGDAVLVETGSGHIFLAPAAAVTNEALIKDQKIGGFACDIIDKFDEGGGIWVNESYHGYSMEPDIWDVAPQRLKNVVYQLCAAAALTVFYLGRRFGRAAPYYEETERVENEYLLQLAAIFERAGNGFVVYETDLESFLRAASLRLGLAWPEGLTPAEKEAAARRLAAEWKTREIPLFDEFTQAISYKESDFNTKTPAGVNRLHNAQGRLRKLEEAAGL